MFLESECDDEAATGLAETAEAGEDSRVTPRPNWLASINRASLSLSVRDE